MFAAEGWWLAPRQAPIEGCAGRTGAEPQALGTVEVAFVRQFIILL
jgi:hypothetical protein